MFVCLFFSKKKEGNPLPVSIRLEIKAKIKDGWQKEVGL
jgi:hypothetical protein